MGKRFRGSVRQRKSEHLAGVQGTTDPGEAKVQPEPGIETSSPAIIATAAAFELSQQQHSRPIASATAAFAADSRAFRV